jgi:RNA polymerase sigma-70 factor (ECF subfamily)
VETVFSTALGNGSASPGSPAARIEPTEEPEWLLAARQGEPWALEQLYHAHQPQVYALCFRLLQRAHDAEDAVQATFVRAFRALPRFRGQSSVRTWLYRIATNEALSMLRRRREGAAWQEEQHGAADGTGGVVERLAVRAALGRLTPEHRAILVLRLWEELSYEEIATVLGISLPAVKMRLNRARGQFRRHYEEQP